MKFIVSGGTGMIGKELTKTLAAEGHEVLVLSRGPAAADLPRGVRAKTWDGKTAGGWGEEVNDADVIVQLAGANIGAKPWTNERKRLIRSSRVDAGEAIVAGLRTAAQRPRVVVSLSGSDIYDNRGEGLRDETAPLGDDFLGQVGKAWENAIRPAGELGARLVYLRSAPVLFRKGGMLAPFVLQNQLFAGGPLGSGRQWLSWVHAKDLVRAIQFVIEQQEAVGVFNVASPEALTNREFGRVVSRVMHRPFWLPVPSFALKIVLGEMSRLVLEGQRITPARLLSMGFRFEFDTLQKALEDLID